MFTLYAIMMPRNNSDYDFASKSVIVNVTRTILGYISSQLIESRLHGEISYVTEKQQNANIPAYFFGVACICSIIP